MASISSLRIVFMGTPDFALASLRALTEAGYHVVGVVTAPDKPAGRGMKLQESPVKKYARDIGIPVLQPEKLRNPAFLEQLRSLKADLQVVVAFRMLPEIVWNMPPLGTINVHASFLPQYRGAAPINWAILNGEKETGISTFRLKHDIDTGNILLREKLPIGDDETAGELHERMKQAGAKLLLKTLEGLENGTLREKPQEETMAIAGESIQGSALKHAPKIFTETCRIDWNKPVREIHNLVRGLSPYPGAFTSIEGKMIKILRSKPETGPVNHPPGEWVSDRQHFLKCAGPDGYLNILELQMEGKKKMSVTDFLRGYRWESTK